MALKEIKADELKTKIQGKTLVIVDFYADWCGPCRQLSPILDQIAKESQGKFEVVKVNVELDEFRDFALQHAVVSIPTVIFFKEGKVVDSFVGLQDKNTIVRMIDRLIK